jgi:DNA-binding SARP family transcriptional activator
VEFRILGPLEVRAAGRAVAVPGAKPRAVLAVLLLNANRSVSAEQLALALWGEEAPAGAGNTIQVHVSRLRKALGAGDHLMTTTTGYRLEVGPDELDVERFERGLAAGREELAAGRHEAAAATLEQALAEWRGGALDDLAYEPFAQGEIARLEEARMAAHELLFEAQLALGRHAEIVGQLEPSIAAHPYREGLRAQLMLALYRCDRQADALQAYQDARERLVEDLGIEPGARLRDLETAILAHDPALAPAAAGGPPVTEDAAVTAARRLVSVVVARSAGGGDAESMHAMLGARAAIIERHGGSVEGVVGDALVGVFGKTEVHEDDALRAVRAALELREQGGMTLGVEAGEAFVGGTFATGEAFTVAAALRAPVGEIVLGNSVYALVRNAVRVEPLDGAWRLTGLAESDVAPPASPFVGRRREMESLLAELARVREEHACRALAVVGPAGIGKSRLAREFVAAIASDATAAVGRCPSYGEGLTYRPLAEIVGALAQGDPSTWVQEQLEPAAAQTLLGAIGLAAAPAQQEETFWAVRRLFERLAENRPLVVVFDDTHWAQPALLDLIDYLRAFVTDDPVLLLCLTRPDVGEVRLSPLVLDPLGEDESRALVAGAVSDATAQRIVETAEGNPLFLEQLVAIGDETELPSTIQAVLAARLARLDPGERTLLEEASVQGRSFYVGALDDDAPATRLIALVRQQLIRPERSELPGQDAFRFAHALIREAAYRSLPKQRRAELHEHVARWTAAWPGAADETVGHHLAEAYRSRAELGVTEHALAGEAAERLADAADAALLRGDPDAGARLLERAAALLDWYPAARGEVLPALAAALFEAGRGDDGARAADEAIAAATEPQLRVRAQIERELIRLGTDTGAGYEPARRVIESGRDALEDDEYGACRLAYLRGRVAWDTGHAGVAEAAWAEAADLAQRAGAERELFELVGWRALAAALGPTPVAEAIGQCEQWRDLVRGSPLATASTLNPLALLHAFRGDTEAAARLQDEAKEILDALGGATARVAHFEAWISIAAGWPERAEPALRAHAESTTDRSARATSIALLARIVLAQGRSEEARELCARAQDDAAAEDLETHVLWRGTLARIRAGESRGDEAEALAREAVALAESTDLLWHTGAAMLDLAAVLRACERDDEAERATLAGLAVYERKGIVASDRRGET